MFPCKLSVGPCSLYPSSFKVQIVGDVSNILFVQVKSKLKGHQKRITGLAFSNSLNVLVSSGADAQVHI